MTKDHTIVRRSECRAPETVMVGNALEALISIATIPSDEYEGFRYTYKLTTPSGLVIEGHENLKAWAANQRAVVSEPPIPVVAIQSISGLSSYNFGSQIAPVCTFQHLTEVPLAASGE